MEKPLISSWSKPSYTLHEAQTQHDIMHLNPRPLTLLNSGQRLAGFANPPEDIDMPTSWNVHTVRRRYNDLQRPNCQHLIAHQETTWGIHLSQKAQASTAQSA